MHVEVVDDIDDIEESAWNALVSKGGFYCSYDWVRRHAALLPAKTAYICVRDGARLIGLAPLSFTRWELSEEYSQRHFGEVFTNDLEYAVLGSRRGYRNLWLTEQGLDAETRGEVLDLLITAASDVAAGWRARAVVAPYLSASAMEQVTGNPRLSDPRPVADEAVLALPYASFDEYLAALPRKPRQNVLRERARPHSFGMRLRVEPIRPDSVDRLAGLMAQVERKYGRRVSVEGLRRYLMGTYAADTRRSRLFTCRTAEDRLVCAAMAFEWRGALYLRATATDYASLPRGSFAHFSVVYYEPIEYCLRNGLDWIHFGREALAAKTARGCEVHPLSHVLIRV